MVRRIVLAAALVALAGSSTAQIVPVTPGGGGAPPAPVEPGGGGIVPGKAPGPGPESENDKAFKELLTGTWRLDLQAPPGWTAWLEFTYNADGSFSGSQISISGNPPPNNRSETKYFGTYTVKALDRSNFTLALTYTSPATATASSDILTYIDQNTLYNPRAGRNVTRVQ